MPKDVAEVIDEPTLSADSHTQGGSKEKSCWVCYGDETDSGELVSPCACRGSVQWIHRSCLRTWLMTSLGSALSLSLSSERTCPQCKSPYNLAKASDKSDGSPKIGAEPSFKSFVWLVRQASYDEIVAIAATIGMPLLLCTVHVLLLAHAFSLVIGFWRVVSNASSVRSQSLRASRVTSCLTAVGYATGGRLARIFGPALEAPKIAAFGRVVSIPYAPPLAQVIETAGLQELFNVSPEIAAWWARNGAGEKWSHVFVHVGSALVWVTLPAAFRAVGGVENGGGEDGEAAPLLQPWAPAMDMLRVAAAWEQAEEEATAARAEASQQAGAAPALVPARNPDDQANSAAADQDFALEATSGPAAVALIVSSFLSSITAFGRNCWLVVLSSIAAFGRNCWLVVRHKRAMRRRLRVHAVDPSSDAENDANSTTAWVIVSEYLAAYAASMVAALAPVAQHFPTYVLIGSRVRDLAFAFGLPMLRPTPALHDPLFKFCFTVASSRVIVVAAMLAYACAAAALFRAVTAGLRRVHAHLLLSHHLN